MACNLKNDYRLFLCLLVYNFSEFVTNALHTCEYVSKKKPVTFN